MARTHCWQRLWGQQVAIDPGTTTTLIYVPERGVVLNQPSVVCLSRPGVLQGLRGVRVELVGDEAKALLGRTPMHLEAVRPLQYGAITSWHAAESMLERFMTMAHTNPHFGRHMEVTVCAPLDATAVELHAIREVMFALGASRVNLLDASLAAALGAGLPVAQAIGSMVLDLGGGTSSAAIVALGDIVHKESIRVGGDQLDEAIARYVRTTRGVMLGAQTAEVVKLTIGSASGRAPKESIRIVGRDEGRCMPCAIELSNHEIADAIEVPIKAIMNIVRVALERAPVELVTDIAERGITLTGGGALLTNLAQRIQGEIGVSAHVADDPFSCAVRGAGKAMLSNMAGSFRAQA
ncbi:rod shape-determining protein [Burkholderia cepacia]|uniref:Cell shape-determining protein MreB n=1 Tax=Burkholderia cepacia TaxID=292 RepID=A0A2S8I9K5_BURCE|nr:rod shape-determining protein [Burkholderia cepacia]PQP11418.1 rod shape-determining protein [Burkholderia cepacia]HDR9511007.1 rod shape-determining protein [Burkholderia cepacia]